MTIFSIADTAVDRLAALNPVEGTYSGVSGYDDRWPDFSPAGNDALLSFWQGLGAEVEASDIDGARDELAHAVLSDECQRAIEWHRAEPHLDDINNIVSPHQELRMVFGAMGDQTPEEWEAIISRLNRTPEALRGYRESLELGRQKQRVVARRQVDALIEQGESAVGENSSYDALRGRLAKAADGSLVGRFGDALDAGITAAQSSFAEFNEYLRDEYRPDARQEDAVGRERYLHGATRLLGASLDPEAAYRYGWDEVERIWNELQDACRMVDDTKTATEVIDMLANDPAWAAANQEEFIDEMTRRQLIALSELDGVHFDIPDQIKTITVQVEPPGGAAAAHYVPPSEDFSRPGGVWYPIAERDHLPMFSEVTTAYHEGFPGHHLQVGLQFAMGDELCRFHRLMVWYSGSGEGWALYAERLMGELGYLERPEYVVGLLSSQLFRSCRIAIDIGSHLGLSIPSDVSFHPGEQWSFELGEKLLVERAMLTPYEARSEMTRYLGWPGQAITYKLGEQAIVDMRDAYSSEPGFALKDFHAKLLALGSLGLDLTRSRMDAAYGRV